MFGSYPKDGGSNPPPATILERRVKRVLGVDKEREVRKACKAAIKEILNAAGMEARIVLYPKR